MVPPSCEVCGTKMRPNGELPSDPSAKQSVSLAKTEEPASSDGAVLKAFSLLRGGQWFEYVRSTD